MRLRRRRLRLAALPRFALLPKRCRGLRLLLPLSTVVGRPPATALGRALSRRAATALRAATR
eukprot:6162244-Alexandrium_andersonii.AAC.1